MDTTALLQKTPTDLPFDDAPRGVASLLEKVPTGLLVGGTWREAAAGDTFEVENPATGDTLATLAAARETDARAALDAACAVQDEWAGTPARERSEILRRAFDLVQERAEDFAALMTLEMGKPLSEARGEVTYGAEYLRWFSEEAVRISGRYSPSPEGNLRMLTVRKPVGPCLLITPWNFPLAMITRKVAPAVAAGCVMVLKPAGLTPLTAQYFAQTMLDAGLPAGVLNIVPTNRSSEISGPLMADRRLRKISFTGSTGVGKILIRQAADNVLRMSMELGGNAPFIVFDDADIDAAVDGAVQAKMRNIGEACTAANRFLVHESIAEEFGRKLAAQLDGLVVGDGMDPATTCGPLVDYKAVDSVAALVDDAVEKGADVLAGGERGAGAGYFYSPTVLTNIPESATILKEEIFGPVAPIITFSTEDEAVEMANDTEYGLASYLFTRDSARQFRMSDRLEFGLLAWNTGVLSNAAAPFGGVKHSGMGREGGLEGIDEYTSLQYIGIQDPYQG